MKLKVIIVDDEISGRETLAELLTLFCDDIEILAKCNDVMSAVDSINHFQPDLVFLDVEMPVYAGYELVQFIEEINFQIIFVTAYDQYALKAFEISAIDYLLKPVDVEKLQAAVEKAKKANLVANYKTELEKLAENIKTASHKLSYLEKGYRNSLLVKEIVAMEAQRAYTKIYLIDNKSIVIARNLSNIEEELKEYNSFKRIHRSWVINMDCIVSYSKTKLEVVLHGGLTVKISRVHKDELLE